MKECGLKVETEIAGKVPTSNTEACTWAQKGMSCFAKCQCDDPEAIQEMADAQALMKILFECSDFKCGAAACLRASVFTGILAALVAIFAAK